MNQPTFAPTPFPPAKQNNPLKLIIFCVLAVIVLVLCMVAAGQIASHGEEISLIESVGGKTLEEAYYTELGGIYGGIAMTIRALGLFGAGVLAYLGLKSNRS